MPNLLIAGFTFNLGDMRFHIGEREQSWGGSCQPEFIDSSKDGWPLRGDVTFLNCIPAELNLKVYREGDLNLVFMSLAALAT